MPQSREGGIQPQRLEFARESTVGVAPTDPSWNLYSDNARTFEPSLSPQTTAQDGLGDPDSAGSYAGTEQHEVTVVYDLQQWLVDGSGNALDASYDGVARDGDNRLPNSHTVVRRMDVGGLDADNTISGNTSVDTRLYFVGKGGYVDEVTFIANVESGQPIQVELTYQFEKGRLYQIDQPNSASQLAVKSTDSNDSTQTVTVQGTDDTDTAASESVTLSGTTDVEITTNFKTIDAVELDAETVGDVELYLDTDSVDGSVTLGNQLAVLHGQSSYDQGEGDLGIPALGTGSHASAIGSSYELPLDGDKFELPSGTEIADNMTSHELTVANNVTPDPTAGGPRPALGEGKREAEVSATVFGQVETYQHTVDMLRSNAQNYKWTASDPTGDTGSIELSNTNVLEVGETEEPQQGKIQVEVTVGQQEGITIA